MSYSVFYSPQTKKKFPDKKETHVKWGRVIAVMVLICIGIGIVSLYKSGVLRELLIPGEPAITVAALETLAENLQEGMPFQQAVEAFCGEILSYAPMD